MRRAWTLVLIGFFAVACSRDFEEQVTAPRSETRNERAMPPKADTEAPAPSETLISWTGCDISKKAYMTEAAAAYYKDTGVRIVVTGGGATRGIRATAGGQSDIGGTCRQCLPGLPEIAGQEDGVVLTHVAWDALVFFTHPTNPIKGISQKQAKAVLVGDIDNWQELGGADKKIHLAVRRQTKKGNFSGVGYMTRLLLFQDSGIQYTPQADAFPSSGPIEKYVEDTEFSFAVTGVSSAKKRKPKVKLLALDGVEPTKDNIADGSYKLFRPLFLVTKSEPSAPTKLFLEWIVSPGGQRVLSDAGTVNLAEGEKLGDLYEHWPKDKNLIRNR